MGYRSPYSTPKNTPSPLELIDASTPWSEVFLEEHAAVQLGTPRTLPDNLRKTFRTYARSWNRTIWLAVFMVAVLSWSLLGGNPEVLNRPVNVDGLQFIDASHPNIRVGNVPHCESFAC
jgi:hypothetical protein